MEINRAEIAARIEAWLAQETAAGRLAWWINKSGEPKMTSPGSKLRQLINGDEDLIERALDLPGLSTHLRKGEALSYRAWSLVVDRLGTSGALPTLPEVLSTRSAYWTACDAAHDARRARDRGAVPKAHARTPETQQAAPERAVEVAQHVTRDVLGQPGDVFAQAALDAYWEEMDRPRGLSEPLWFVAREIRARRQDFEVWRWRKAQSQAARVAAWMDQAPAWGEEVAR